MATHRQIPGPFTVDELITRQCAYEVALKAGKYRYDHLDTGWSLDELLEMKASFDSLDDF